MMAPADLTKSTSESPQEMSLVGLSYNFANGAVETETAKKAHAAHSHAK